jgi:hypothetical protein
MPSGTPSGNQGPTYDFVPRRWISGRDPRMINAVRQDDINACNNDIRIEEVQATQTVG